MLFVNIAVLSHSLCPAKSMTPEQKKRVTSALRMTNGYYLSFHLTYYVPLFRKNLHIINLLWAYGT